MKTVCALFVCLIVSPALLIAQDQAANDSNQATFKYECYSSRCDFTFDLPAPYVEFVDAGELQSATENLKEDIAQLTEDAKNIEDEQLLQDIVDSLEAVNATSAEIVDDAEKQSKNVVGLNDTLQSYYVIAQRLNKQADCFQAGLLSSSACGELL